MEKISYYSVSPEYTTVSSTLKHKCAVCGQAITKGHEITTVRLNAVYFTSIKPKEAKAYVHTTCISAIQEYFQGPPEDWEAIAILIHTNNTGIMYTRYSQLQAARNTAFMRAVEELAPKGAGGTLTLKEYATEWEIPRFDIKIKYGRTRGKILADSLRVPGNLEVEDQEMASELIGIIQAYIDKHTDSIRTNIKPGPYSWQIMFDSRYKKQTTGSRIRFE
jgi:rRNA maturation protein Nop10